MLKKIAKPFFFLAGLLAFALGIAGIFLPLLPTTPFILLSAFCWAKSSQRFHNWLLAHRIFGPMIHNWQQYGSVPRRAKWIAIVTMSISLIWLIGFQLQSLTAKLGVAAVMIPMAVWMISRPNSEDKIKP